MTSVTGLRASLIGGCGPSYSNFIYSGTGLHRFVTSGASTRATSQCGRGVDRVHRITTSGRRGNVIVGGRRVGAINARRRAGAMDGAIIYIMIITTILILVMLIHYHHGGVRRWRTVRAIMIILVVLIYFGFVVGRAFHGQKSITTVTIMTALFIKLV